MKIRQGFVSNSSSSSFVIISKDGELTEDKIKKAFESAKGSPFEGLIDDCVKTLLNRAEKTEIKDILSDYGHNTFDDYYNSAIGYKEDEIIANALMEGKTVYKGSISDQDDRVLDGKPVEDYILCGAKIDYEDSEIIIYKEAWY